MIFIIRRFFKFAFFCTFFRTYFSDARSLIAAMALGAEGMNMGTRFIATQDAPVHQNVKEAIVNASELDTRLIMRSLTNTERVLNNPVASSASFVANIVA